MQYSTIFLTLLAATGAIAAPSSTTTTSRDVDDSVRVILSDLGETGAQRVFPEPRIGEPQSGKPSQFGPFKTVELKLGPGVKNKALRCKILDERNHPIPVVRGGAPEITFADGGKGEWTFQEGESKVKKIICDQKFVKGGDAGGDDDNKGDDNDKMEMNKNKKGGKKENGLRVSLSNQSQELGIQRTLTAGVRDVEPVSGKFETVALNVDDDVDEDYRCKILDTKRRPITVVRGGVEQTSFADKGKGEWTLKKPTKVIAIVCDPTFKI